MSYDKPVPKNLVPKSNFERVVFHKVRLELFLKVAIRAAHDADRIVVEHRAQAVKKWAGEKNDARRDVLAFADASADPKYRDAVATNQLYDRWAMREAAAHQSAIAQVEYDDRFNPSIRFPMDRISEKEWQDLRDYETMLRTHYSQKN